ncbi:MAG: flippase [Candidatus Omnitrophica bacterium]|nr:flippase [Candidatus Omnitrophota bacterium]
MKNNTFINLCHKIGLKMKDVRRRDILFFKLKTNSEMKRIIENFLSLSLLQGLNYFLPLIILPYLVRVIGIEKFGLLSFATATIVYFQILTDYGFNLSATREIAINRANKYKIQEIFNSVIFIKCMLTFISFILLAIIVLTFKRFRNDWIVYFLTFGIVVGNTLFPIWFFQGMEKMKYITFLNILAKGLFTLTIFIFVKNWQDYWKVPLLNSLGFISSGILSLWIISKNFDIKFIKPGFNSIKTQFIDSSQFFLSRVSVSIYTSSNVFILGIFTNNTMVGYYSIAEKLYQALQQVYFPLTQATYPYIANTKNSKLFKKIFKFATIGNFIIVILLFVFAGSLFEILFSNRFNYESIYVFRILLISALIVVPSIILGYPFLAAMGYPEYANKSVIYGSLLHIFGLLLLVITNHINIYSVAILVILTETTVLIYRIYFSIREGLWMTREEK